MTSIDVVAIAPLLAIGVALLFGTLTIRQWQATRQLTAAAELVHTMQTPEFTSAIRCIMDLPVGRDADALLADREVMAAFYTIIHVFESLGVLVFHRLLPLHLVDHLCGGYVRSSWRRLEPLVLALRTTHGATIGEWYQWLADRIEQYPAPGKDVGAAVAYKDWKP
jgi:hypothetical protein